ncbi:MAG: hypothetical protein Q8910_06565 [Bacteroidota bacterium]|nr:hypothetical protein [Bacteroidota bacterium]
MIDAVYEHPNDIHLYAIGDTHIGDKGFTRECGIRLQRVIDEIEEDPDAFVFFGGDLVNCATLGGKSSIFEQELDLMNQIERVKSYFLPIRHKILGLIDGNHEMRISKVSGMSAAYTICQALQIPYFKTTAIIDFKLGERTRGDKKGARTQYTGVFQHTTGGGSTTGSKVNRTELMRTTTIVNADFYVAFHKHLKNVAELSSREYDPHNKKQVKRSQWLIDAGSFLEWDNTYPEGMQLKPMALGCAEIRLKGEEKKIDAHLV